MTQLPKNNTLFCAIRREYVKATPEEKVRQRLIQVMKIHLGYPLALIGVEKAIDQMFYLSELKTILPERRADLICFAKDVHPNFSLYPLLLIECKAVPITAQVIRQVIGYNHYINAHFVAVANEGEIRTGCIDRNTGEYHFVDTLPSFEELVKQVCILK